MTTGTQSPIADVHDPEPAEVPEITTCETSPGRVVFLESGNTDGWLASDVTVDVTR